MKIFNKMKIKTKKNDSFIFIRVYSYIKNKITARNNQAEEIRQLKEQIIEFNTFKNSFYKLIAPYNIFPESETFTIEKWIPQNIYFAKDIADEILKKVIIYIDSTNEKTTKISLADIGGGVGAGSAYIRAFIQRELYKKYKREIYVSMDVYDLQYNFKQFCERFFPDCNFLCSDFSLVEKKYHFVISSHCIEHVENPHKFITDISAKATYGVFVYAPYDEQLTNELKIIGHINSIGENFITKTKPSFHKLVKSDGYNIYCILLFYKIN